MKRSNRSKKEIKYRMTPYLEKIIARVEKDIKNNRNIIGPFRNAEEMDKYFNSL